MQRPPGRVQLRRAFGKTIRDLRKRIHLSQEHLALETGMGRSYMGKLERGQSMPTVQTLFKLLPGLKVSAVEFIQELERNIKR